MTAPPRLIAAVVRIYGAAMVVCPRTVRQRYGDEMRRTVEAQCRDAAGTPAVAGLLARELADLVVASIAARSGPLTQADRRP